MADPTGDELEDNPNAEGSPAPLGPPFAPGAPPPFLVWSAFALGIPTPPPPAPGPPLALTTSGTVSDAEGAWERYKDLPARALTVEEATAVLLDLKAQGALKWTPKNILGLASMPWGGIANTFKVRKPGVNGEPPSPWFAFDYKRGEECDPRMAVLLYKLATYLYAEQDVTGMDLGILRESTRAEFSCHNQGRAVDIFRVRWGSETLDILECWGSLPLRMNGEVIRQWNGRTRAFDTGDPILGPRAIGNFLQNAIAEKARQERLNPEIEVDAAVLQSVLGEPDPGPEEEWSEHTREKVASLQTKLRRAAKIFLGMFDFFVREATIRKSPLAFSKEPMTEIANKPISRINSGHMCIPDGTAWSAHQNHFHVQVGPTGWAQNADSDTELKHEDVDPAIRTFLYQRITKKIVSVLSGTYTEYEKALQDEKDGFEKKKQKNKIPADAKWEDWPKAKDLQRALGIAAGYKDQAVLRRIETYDAAKGLPEFGAPTDFQTVRGRVLRKWYQGISAAGKGGRSPWRTQDWLKKLVIDPSLTVAQARAKLVQQIQDDLNAWRKEVTGELFVP